MAYYLVTFGAFGLPNCLCGLRIVLQLKLKFFAFQYVSKQT